MDTSAALVKAYQDALRRKGIDPVPLAAQAEALVDLSDLEFEQGLQAFNVGANDHSYCAPALDSDYGALLLEALADACASLHRRQQLYQGAVGRAAIFASYATSGGEGLARSMDVERIAGKLEGLDTEQGWQGGSARSNESR